MPHGSASAQALTHGTLHTDNPGPDISATTVRLSIPFRLPPQRQLLLLLLLPPMQQRRDRAAAR